MIELRIAQGSGPTGRLLAELLQQRGVETRLANGYTTPLPQAYVCYGAGMCGNGRPVLNSSAGRQNKLQQFETLHAANVRTLKVVMPNDPLDAVTFPLFGRKLQHKEGKDIMVALQAEDVPLRVAAGAQFFTQYIPRETEFRVWTYRRRHLGTYQKVMVRPHEYRYFGCSYRNGFAFQLVPSEQVPREAVELAGNAVQALDLDFGAVDILKGKDNRYYVLEINTAPGVEDGRRQVIQALADKIANWQQHGFPRRNGANEE